MLKESSFTDRALNASIADLRFALVRKTSACLASLILFLIRLYYNKLLFYR